MRLYILLSLVCAFDSSKITDHVESRLVLINSGPVRGYKDPQEDVFVFYGIPYAKAPTGTQRFKAPLPPPLWSEPFEAVKNNIVCPQTYEFHIFVKPKDMKEDCLIANLYVPKTRESDLSVVVYVHGGAFLAGFSELVKPMNLVKSKKVIAVTFNYRVGAHGFLCLGTEDVPGNAGMKDQVALLRWVQKNIVSFGGNSNDVTIIGYSAGSAAVDLLMMSKMAKGLFNKVIPESGAGTCPYSIQVDPIKNAKEYAKLIEINNVDDMVELENSYKNVSYHILQSGNVLFRTDSTFLLSPCVERDNGQEIFLDDSPVNILNQGNFTKLPMLCGFANMEGLDLIKTFDIWKKEMNKNFTNFLPTDLRFKTPEEAASVANMIKKFYFGDKPVDDNTVMGYVDFWSDVMFKCPTLRNINYRLKSGHDQIYLYQYSYTDENTPFVPKTEIRGAKHCGQTNAVLEEFEYIHKPNVTSEDYVKMKRVMKELWLNFIIHGKPMASGFPAWPTVSENWSPYMDLNKNSELRGPLLKEACGFWDKIYGLHYNNPIPPLHPNYYYSYI